MAGVIENIANSVLGWYQSLIGYFSPSGQAAVNMLLLALVIIVVALFVWSFYNALSKRDIIGLNLKQYNRSAHPAMSKFVAIVLYFVEYILVMPLVMVIWFAALSIMLLLIAPERDVGQLLLITGATVAAIRVLAYHRQEIAKDLAKLFPFIALALFLLSPGEISLESIITQFGVIPELFASTLVFLIGIFNY